MPEKTLFIKIFQPFAQYRNPFTFYYAQTYPLPPKSTIIGMLQNACDDWYGTKFGIENWWNLKVSVHGGFESFFWNYQNLIKGELDFRGGVLVNKCYRNSGGDGWLPLYGEGITSQRSPVYQQELFNGCLFIFLKGDEEIINKIEKALKKLNKVLSLGRSEDVAFIKHVELFEPSKSIKVEGDLKLTFPTYILQKINKDSQEMNFPIKNQKYPVYSIPVKIIFENNGKKVTHKAEITKTTKRKVEFKSVIYTGHEYNIILSEGNSINVEIYNLPIKNNKEIRIIELFGWL